jgi:ectoine hydroxylase-related dioxygenase (phytanoyl-CoA dioxygenase family)
LRQALPAACIEALDADLAEDFATTPFGTGAFYGEATKRFGRLLTRSPHCEALIMHDAIVASVEHCLTPWCDCIQLNTAQAIAIYPGAPAQVPHRDQAMWRAPAGEMEYLVNVIWPLTPFTRTNGATRLWPGSHGAAACEAEPLGSPIAPELVPGDALLFLGSTLHSAGANRSEDVRRAIVVGYSLGWLKAYENQMLAYPPPVARRFPPALAALVGYRQHRPNLGNYEGQCPSILLGHGPIPPLGAVDALLPEQVEMVDAYARDQRSSP